MEKYIEIDTSFIEKKQMTSSLFENRRIYAEYNVKNNNSDVTILVLAYNNLEKTKRCVESILKYTKEIDYDLLLIDNGSTDGTIDYFNSIDFNNKYIIRITDNKGGLFPGWFFNLDILSKYYVCVPNDIIVTENWLKNLIIVAESDSKIGMVVAMSSNTSNLQDPMIAFKDYNDMQDKAKSFNVSDPRKWHERLRLMTLTTLYRKECLNAAGIVSADVGFAHNFGDDDVTFRVRRAGYKAVLAGDTWVHHDDIKTGLTQERAKEINDDLLIGRENFKDKYFGIDAWDDVNNYIPQYVSALECPNINSNVNILGIDVKCGTPILEIKNNLRKFDIFDANCYAFTTDAKYYLDLQTICGGYNVKCGSIDTFQVEYKQNMFADIVIGNDINTYKDPFSIIDVTYRLLDEKGQLFFSLQNAFSIFALANILGHTDKIIPDHSINYTVEDLMFNCKKLNYDIRYIGAMGYNENLVNKQLKDYAVYCLDKVGVKEKDEALFRMLSQRYYFVINKK